LYVSDESVDVFEAEHTPPDLVHFTTDGDEAFLHICNLAVTVPTRSVLSTLLPELAEEACREHKVELVEIDVDPGRPSTTAEFNLVVKFPYRRRTVAEAHFVGVTLGDIVGQGFRGAYSYDQAREALGRGHPALLIG
jgi:hypothetical protein